MSQAVDLYLVPSTSPDGRPILAYCLTPLPGPRRVGTIQAPEGSAVDVRRGSVTVLLIPTPSGTVALSAVDAAQQAEVGGCGLRFVPFAPMAGVAG